MTEVTDVLNNFHLDKFCENIEISKIVSCAAPFSNSSDCFLGKSQNIGFSS